MKGKPVSTPTNHVEWPNGFKSNMPNWIVARECAAAHEMLHALKEARKILLLCDQKGIIASLAYSESEQSRIYKLVDLAIDVATGMDTIGGETIQEEAERRGITDCNVIAQTPLPNLEYELGPTRTRTEVMVRMEEAEERTVISKQTIRERASMPDFPMPPGFPPLPKVGE